jgi:uncharacterized protein (TIRG00374 family)
MHSHIRRTLLTVVKIVLAVAMLAWLVFKGWDAFENLSAASIDWSMMAAALFCTLIMAGLSYLRWHILIRAVGIEARLVDTLRLGSLGFAMNFVSPGSVGGDFFKAIFLAHGHPSWRPEAIATVIVDRVMGLLTMLLLASIGILATGLLHTSSHGLQVVCHTILFVSVAAWIGSFLFVAVPTLTGPFVRGWVEKIPFAGRPVARMLDTVQVYRSKKMMLAAAFAISIVMSLFYVTSYYLVAEGLPIRAPSLVEHMVIIPTSGVVGAIPVSFNGLGITEGTIDWLYRKVPKDGGPVEGDGTLVGLSRRVPDIAVALIGLVFYLTHRREVQEVYAEAEQVAETE